MVIMVKIMTGGKYLRGVRGLNRGDHYRSKGWISARIVGRLSTGSYVCPCSPENSPSQNCTLQVVILGNMEKSTENFYQRFKYRQNLSKVPWGWVRAETCRINKFIKFGI